MTGQSPSSPHLRGAAMILAAALVISVQDVVIKLYSADMTLWQIFALRGAMVVPILMAYGALTGVARQTLSKAFSAWPMLRAIFITTTFLAFYAALPFLNLSTVGAANYSAPIFITLFSAFLIRLPVGPRGWLAVLIGFAGVFLLLRPGSDAFSLWALLPIMGACFYALAHIVTCTKCRETPLLVLALSQSVVMMMAGVVVSVGLVVFPQNEALAFSTPYIFGPWSEMSLSLWSVLAVLSGLAIAAAVLLAGAYQAAPPVMVGTLEYSYLLFVVLWDIVIFSVIPGVVSLSGMVLIVAAGLLVMRANTTHPED